MGVSLFLKSLFFEAYLSGTQVGEAVEKIVRD